MAIVLKFVVSACHFDIYASDADLFIRLLIIRENKRSLI